MLRRILLLGRKPIIVADAQTELYELDLEIFAGTNINDLRSVFSDLANHGDKIDHVFIGAGIELEKRLEIVKEVFTQSRTTTVHLKGANVGSQGFLPFVKAVLKGIDAENF